MKKCQWFARCDNDATGSLVAPFGRVRICARCLAIAQKHSDDVAVFVSDDSNNDGQGTDAWSGGFAANH